MKLLVWWCLASALAVLIAEPATTIGRSEDSDVERQALNVGLILPHTSWRVREYRRKTMEALQRLLRAKRGGMHFHHVYRLALDNIHLEMLNLTPSPTAILETFCASLLPRRVAALIHLTNSEQYGRSTASTQYLSQLAHYLAIPVISWHADNSGLHSQAGPASQLQLQLAPSVVDQVRAMLAILRRYRWHRVFVVTSQVAGHQQFAQTVRNQADLGQRQFKLTIIGSLVVQNSSSDLAALAHSDARVMLLYSTRDEASVIMQQATSLGLTGANYVWIATQSVQGSTDQAARHLPIGMLGVHFSTGEASMSDQIGRGLAVFVAAIELMLTATSDTAAAAAADNPPGTRQQLQQQQLINEPLLSCNASGHNSWQDGQTLFNYMRAVNISDELTSTNRLQFNTDGTLQHQQLVITNLRQSTAGDSVWEPIGLWRSTGRITSQLTIRDIVWPGYSPAPPQGVPEKFHLRIAFMEESPYIVLDPPDPSTGKCVANRGVPCLVPSSLSKQRDNGTIGGFSFRCCSGFCIDLLEKLAHDLAFTYDLVRNEDGLWGARVMKNGQLQWNGLPGSLIEKRADMVMTSFKINSYRQSAVEFTVPFLDTGITIVVAKRTGIISPTAFLEPFDSASWLLVSLVAIQAAAAAIFFFEWLSPSGCNMKMSPPPNYEFSLFRTFWLVWSTLFQAAVHVDVPRGLTAKFMAIVWALFALIFLAIYTANLAAFMITREEYYNLKGIDDPRLVAPNWRTPPFRFGTVLYGNTDSVLKQNFPNMRSYMLPYNRSSVVQGIQAVKRGELDAFIYDATVLEYFSGEDNDCQLLTVGQWYAMTGYGVAFPRNSRYTHMFNQRILEYRQTGDIERLHRFWFTGSCKPGQNRNSSSKPLTLDQFLSTFMLLGCGILVALFLLFVEAAYFRWVRPLVATSPNNSRTWVSLISLSLGRSMLRPDNPTRKNISESSHSLCEHRSCTNERRHLLRQLAHSRQRLLQLRNIAAKTTTTTTAAAAAAVLDCTPITKTRPVTYRLTNGGSHGRGGATPLKQPLPLPPPPPPPSYVQPIYTIPRLRRHSHHQDTTDCLALETTL